MGSCGSRWQWKKVFRAVLGNALQCSIKKVAKQNGQYSFEGYGNGKENMKQKVK